MARLMEARRLGAVVVDGRGRWIGIGELAQRLEVGLWLREMVLGIGLWWWRRVVGQLRRRV